jgi:hypothetical protein
MKKMILASLVAITALAGTAAANCRIKNETKWSFKVESGNVSNQSVGANTTTSIADGRVVGKDDKAGKSFSTSCKTGDTIKIKDDRGTPVVEVEKKK